MGQAKNKHPTREGRIALAQEREQKLAEERERQRVLEREALRQSKKNVAVLGGGGIYRPNPIATTMTVGGQRVLVTDETAAKALEKIADKPTPAQPFDGETIDRTGWITRLPPHLIADKTTPQPLDEEAQWALSGGLKKEEPKRVRVGTIGHVGLGNSKTTLTGSIVGRLRRAIVSSALSTLLFGKQTTKDEEKE